MPCSEWNLLERWGGTAARTPPAQSARGPRRGSRQPRDLCGPGRGRSVGVPRPSSQPSRVACGTRWPTHDLAQLTTLSLPPFPAAGFWPESKDIEVPIEYLSVSLETSNAKALNTKTGFSLSLTCCRTENQCQF